MYWFIFKRTFFKITKKQYIKHNNDSKINCLKPAQSIFILNEIKTFKSFQKGRETFCTFNYY